MPRAASSSSWYAARASRAIRAPDTSPRSDIRAWHSEIALRAPRTAARGTVPGRRPMDPKRRRKKDFCAGEFMRFETAAEACSFNVSTILARPAGSVESLSRTLGLISHAAVRGRTQAVRRDAAERRQDEEI